GDCRRTVASVQRLAGSEASCGFAIHCVAMTAVWSLQKARAPTADSAGTAVTLKVDAGDPVHPETVKTYPAFFPVARPLSISMAGCSLVSELPKPSRSQ